MHVQPSRTGRRLQRQRFCVAGPGEDHGKNEGEASVTYATGASFFSVSASSDLADLTETAFWLQLLSLLRLHSKARYVP